MKLLVCDPTAPDAIAAMQEAGIEVDVRDDITPEELETAIAGYDAMVVRSRTKVRAPLIDKATNLKLVVRGGVGLDNIDVEYAQSKGVEVRNTPAASSNSVAELTIGYLFALARPISQATASMKAGKWEKKTFGKGMELAGKTLGLVGCGRIGSLVAQKAAALGIEVLFYRRTRTEVDGATQVSLDELCARSDFISLHLPHTPATHYIIGEEAFEKMKDGVRIVNCGRGGTLDESALYEAIVSGKVAGAALDVFEDEKEKRGRRLMELPQVIGSPHVGAGTGEAKVRVGEEVAQIAVDFHQQHHT
ncbi:MAG: D-2-hydroxyacid dehydrogenase [Chloroflexota bacterium]|nr:D-2-hydroxyacid dehydrogenase [Chloroflexota bacterium]